MATLAQTEILLYMNSDSRRDTMFNFNFFRELCIKIKDFFGSLKSQVPVITEPQVRTGASVLKEYLGLNESESADQLDMMWQEYGRPNYTHKTPWCGLAIAMAEVESGYINRESVPKKFELARRWLTSYDKEKYDLIKDPLKIQVGDIMVRWRVSKDSWQGHVEYYLGPVKEKGQYKDGRYKRYLGIGGNISDSITIDECDITKFLGALRRKA